MSADCRGGYFALKPKVRRQIRWKVECSRWEAEVLFPHIRHATYHLPCFLHVIVKNILIGVRPQAHGIVFLLALVLDPSFDQVFGKYVAFE